MLDIETALRAYASMMNALNSSKLEPLLSDDFHYASQMVLAKIETKQEYLEYIKPKLEVVRASGTKVWAEMAMLTHSLRAKRHYLVRRRCGAEAGFARLKRC
jgi:hypothetical protein